MSRSYEKKHRREKKTWTVGITAEGQTIMSEGTPSEQLIVRRVFHVYNPQRSAEIRSWLDVTKDVLSYYS